MRIDDPRLNNSQFAEVESHVSTADALARARLKYGNHITLINQKEKEVGSILGSKKVYVVNVWLNPPSQTRSAINNLQQGQSNQQGQLNYDQRNNPSALEQKPKEKSFLENDLLQQLFDKVSKIDEAQSKLGEMQSKIMKNGSSKQNYKEEGFEELANIYDVLVNENDFSPAFAKHIVDSVKKSLYGDELENKESVESEVLKEIGRGLSFFEPKLDSTPRVFILVGTTGIGKTTTIVKLTAINLIANPNLDIRLINMDNYKIGAKEQLDTYADVLHRPVITIYDPASELGKVVEDTRDSDLILVDTSGSSPHEVIRLADLKTALDHFGKRAEVHLALCASTKESDVRDILSNFELYRCKSVLITKLDETRRIGSLIAPLIEKRIPISYLTTGQNVGVNEIEKATLKSIWERLNGFSDNVINKLLQQLEESV